MKHNNIEITTTSIIGKEIRSGNFVNLTSVNNSMINVIMSRVPFIPAKVRYINFNKIPMYDCESGKKITYRNSKLLATAIVDGDDNLKDIKFLNLSRYYNIQVLTVITIKYKSNKPVKTNDNVNQGKIARICNYGHTHRVMKQLRAIPLNQTIIGSCSEVIIVKTNDKLCTSIDSIKFILKEQGKKFKIEYVNVEYMNSLLMFKKKEKVNFYEDNVTNDYIPEGDTTWINKQGYSNMVMTNKGIKRVRQGLPDVVDKKVHAELKSKENKFISIITKIISKIVEYCKMVITSLMDKFKNKTHKSTDNEGKGESSNKIQQTTTAITFTNNLVSAFSNACSVAMSQVDKNASKDIKKANKLIANMQLNKIAAKTGISGDKTYLTKDKTDAFNAYLAATTSYNTNEAVTMANNMASKDYSKKKMYMTSLLMLIVIVSMAMGNSIVNVTMSLSVLIIDYFSDIFKNETVYNIIPIIHSNSLIMWLTTMGAFTVEYNIKNSTTKAIRNIIYAIITCLTYMI